MIILRYLCREVFHATLAVTALLLVIVVCNMFVHYLAVAAAGSMMGGAVIKLIGLTVPRYIAIILPISLFLGILLAYGRLFANNELLVMFACGMTWKRLMAITLLPTIFCMIVVAILALEVIPNMSLHTSQLTAAAAAKENVSMIKPGRFVAINGGKQVVYIGNSSITNRTVSNLFVYRNPGKGQPPQVILAPLGYQKTDPKTHQHYIVLKNGWAYKGWPGQQQFQTVHFDSFAARLALPNFSHHSDNLEATSTLKLIKKRYDIAQQVELQWRLSMPIVVLVLMFIGLGLCYVGPRRSRYAKLIPAVLVFILYYNLITISRSWMLQGKISPYLGLWWVHATFLILALIWLWHLDGHTWFRRQKRAHT